jgi:acyl carrier protein phosphodiesterase
MNYLGHLYLADDTAESLIGNLLGDFVKGSIHKISYPLAIAKGIELHRKVDVFTDSHTIFRTSVKRISAVRRRFAGIMIDIFYDHFLAKNWSRYSTVPLQNFSQNVYGILTINHSLLPERLQRMLPYIVREDWLTSYANISAIHTTLNRLSNRFKRENGLLNSAEELLANYETLEADFHDFFPDLIRYVQTYRETES